MSDQDASAAVNIAIPRPNGGFSVTIACGCGHETKLYDTAAHWRAFAALLLSHCEVADALAAASPALAAQAAGSA